MCNVSIQTDEMLVDQSPHCMGDGLRPLSLISPGSPGVQCDPCKAVWTASPDMVYQTSFPIAVDQERIIICTVPVLNELSEKTLGNVLNSATQSVSHFQRGSQQFHNSASQTNQTQANFLTLCNANAASVSKVPNSMNSLKREPLNLECKMSLDEVESEIGVPDALSCGYSDSLEDVRFSLPHLTKISPNIHKPCHVLQSRLEEHL